MMFSSRILIVITFAVIGTFWFITSADGQMERPNGRRNGGMNRGPGGGMNRGPYGGPNGQRKKPNGGMGQNGMPRRSGNGMPMRGSAPNMQSPSDNLPSYNGNNPSLNRNDPSLNDNLPSPDGNLPSPDGNLPTPNDNLPSPNSNLPSPNGNLPSPDGNNPSLNSNTPSPNGNAPSLNGNTPSLNGNNPTPAGNTQSLNGKHPTPAGNIPTPDSSVSPPTGLDDPKVADLTKNVKQSVKELGGRIYELLMGTKAILRSIKNDLIDSLTGPDMLDGLGRIAVYVQAALSTVGGLVSDFQEKGIGAVGDPDTLKSVDKLQDLVFNTLGVTQAVLDQLQSIFSDTKDNLMNGVGAIVDAAQSAKMATPAKKLLTDVTGLTTNTVVGVLDALGNLKSSADKLGTVLKGVVTTVQGFTGLTK